MRPGVQKEVWANGAGDDWLDRNREKLGEHDLACDAIKQLGAEPKSVLEVGCSNGWRLKKLKERYGCRAVGIDIAEKALMEAQAAGHEVHLASSDKLPFPDNTFDTIIYGYCFCFISPEEWIQTVAESDRTLKDGGLIVIYDFFCTDYVKRRIMGMMKDPEIEKTPNYIYHYNLPKLWTGHPAYKPVMNLFGLGRGECCTVLQKRLADLLIDFDENGKIITT